jgi:GT2 family glycosyltransferase
MSTCCIIIPTRNRHDDLVVCLSSIATQTLRPDVVIVVDSTPQLPDGAEQIYRSALGPVPLHYQRARRPGSASQRNEALGLIPDWADYAFLLDDDVVLESDYCEELVTLLEAEPTAAGATGWITNPQQGPGERWMLWMLRLFLIYGRDPGTVLPSGFNTPLWVGERTTPFRALFLEGGNACLRVAALGDLRFDESYERFGGYAYAEDIDFTYILRKRGALWITQRARMVHKVSRAGRMNDLRIGLCQVTNRARFVARHLPGPLNFACYLWSMLGIMLLNLGMIVLGRSPRRLLGNLVGLTLVLSGHVRPSVVS